jgi:hypothetical protein
MSAWFARWSEFSIRHRWWVLLVAVLITAGFARAARRDLTLDTRWERMYSAEQLQVLERVRKDFDADDLFLLLVRGDVYSQPYLARLDTLHAALERLDLELPSRGDAPAGRPGGAAKPAAQAGDDFFAGFDGGGPAEVARASVFEQIISLVNVRQTRWDGGALRVGGLMDAFRPGDDPAALRAQVQDGTAAKVVSAKGDYSLVILRTGFIDQNDTAKVHDALAKLAHDHGGQGFEIALAGGATFRAVLAATTVRAGRQFTLWSFLLMSVLLGLIFRHPLGVIGPIAVIAATIAWTLGSMALLGISLTTQTLVLPQLLICISITDAIHIQSVYAVARARGQDNLSAIRYSMHKNAVPVFLTTATTAAGLLSFLASGVRPVWELGVFGALGTSLALVITVLILPPLLSFNKRSTFGARAQARTPDLLDRALGGLGRLLQGDRARRLVLGSMVLAAGLGVLGASRLELGLFPLGWFPRADPMRQAFAAIDDELGGSNELRILIEPRRGTVADRQLLLGLEQLEREILAYRDPKLQITLAGESTSILDLVRESWRAFNGGEASAYAIPPNDAGARDMLTFLQNGAPHELKHLITLNADSAILNVRVRWVESPRYLEFADHIARRAQALLGERARITFTGPSYNVAVVGMRLVDGLTQSFVIAFVLVGFLIVVQCRSLRLGLIAMVPNALAIGIVFAAFGLFGIPIDAANVTFASIALGIIDDDAIHFIHGVADARDEGLDLGAAIQSAYVHAGRAMVIASTIVGLGFALRLGEYLRLSRDFGMLMTLSCIMGLIANLVFVPALLRTFGLQPRKEARGSEAIEAA